MNPTVLDITGPGIEDTQSDEVTYVHPPLDRQLCRSTGPFAKSVWFPSIIAITIRIDPPIGSGVDRENTHLVIEVAINTAIRGPFDEHDRVVDDLRFPARGCQHEAG